MTNEEFQKIVLEELRGIKRELGGLKEDVGGLKEDVGGLKEDVGGLKEDVGGLKVDVSGLKEGQILLIERVDMIERTVDAIYEQTADLTEFKEETNKNIKKIQVDNGILKEMVGRHDIEIKALERKIG